MFASIYKLFNNMQISEEVDLGVLDNLNELEVLFKKDLEYWSNIKLISPSLAFPFYFAAGNSLEVIEGMKRRFKAAKSIGDNPAVVDDALEVLPELERIVKINEGVRKNPKDAAPFHSREIMDIARTLRINAQSYDMYYPKEISERVLESRIKAIDSEIEKILENE